MKAEGDSVGKLHIKKADIVGRALYFTECVLSIGDTIITMKILAEESDSILSNPAKTERAIYIKTHLVK